MSNPLLNDKHFNDPAQRSDTAARGTIDAQWNQSYDQLAHGTQAATTTGAMTMGGTVSATLVLFAFAIATAVYGWSRVSSEFLGFDATGARVYGPVGSMGWLFGPMIVGFGLAMVTSFKPHLAKVLAIPYALAQGLLLGFISHYYNIAYPGIAVTAVLATAGVFAAMLVLYGFRVLRVTPRMTKAVIAATFGVLVVYLVNFVVGLFTSGPSMLAGSGPVSIAVSVIVVGIAAFNLLLDFDFIEKGVANRLPKEYEWFAAFGLMVTIIWLYLELLRLLSKLRDN
ncbi:MAG: Bax inhibitor-1/YccA family protein [Microthrixaceae bacterium]|nr:Bax inhibitor-1/YccA family protein [Microthrixaceae bacterium]